MSRFRPFAAIAVAAVFIWIIFVPPPALKHIRANLTSIAVTPIEVIAKSFSYVTRIYDFFYTEPETTRLKEKVRRLEKELAERQEAMLENKRLRALLNFKQLQGKYSIPAMVIGRDPNNWSSVIYIDKGSNDGIALDMAVAAEYGLVGRVREVLSSTSKVMLINDVQSQVGAVVHRNREQGVMVGTASGGCRLIYLSADSDVMEGDKVLTSGMGGVYPKAILIGHVASVGKERGRLYKYAVIRPAADLDKLEEVLCIK